MGKIKKLYQKFIRFKYHWLYSSLPEFYQEFYPPKKAVSLLVQNCNHQMESAQSMDKLACKCIGKTAALEQEVADLELQLALAGTVPNVAKQLCSIFGLELPQRKNINRLDN